jgi:hypothetical protein
MPVRDQNIRLKNDDKSTEIEKNKTGRYVDSDTAFILK